MSYEAQDKKGYQHFRTTLNIAMGIIYIALGGVAITLRNFGNFALDTTKAFLLGGLLMAYGGFRLWRGVQELQLRRKEKLRDEADRIAEK